jgi:23S rRNA (adenine2503-C2)-methyltransferase
MMAVDNIYNFTLDELSACCKAWGLPEFAAKQVFNWVYKKGLANFSQMTNLPKEVRVMFEERFVFAKPEIVKIQRSSDGTNKFLLSLADKNYIEAVLIPKDKRDTLCLSTQVGCKFKCAFCASGKFGFIRNLRPDEIIGQFIRVGEKIAPEKISNIVFMGIGEPLDNFASLIKTIKILTEKSGISFVKRRICVSTCGLTPQIDQLTAEKLGVKLSISLHSADNATRGKLMPINRKYPLPELIKAARAFSRSQKCVVTFEYALIGGCNLKKDDALKLSRLLRGLRYKLNLIPLNTSGGQFKAPTADEARIFADELKRKKIFFTTRQARGSDINAACGQLRVSFSREKRNV